MATKKKTAKKTAAAKMTWETWRAIGIVKQLEIAQAWFNKHLAGKTLYVEPFSFYDLIKSGSTEGSLSTSLKDIDGGAFAVTLDMSQLARALSERDVIALYEDTNGLS